MALRWWWDDEPAIVRQRSGRGFRYLRPDGTTERDPATLRRIRSLAIPPAWSDVRICPFPEGHLQAVGRDARGRKQYRYHPDFRARREADKYARLVAFGESLPAIRRRVEADLARPGLPREKVIALVVRLLDLTRLRVGNDEYRRANRSFGLTTLRDRHARVEGDRLRLRFRGKAGVPQEAAVVDRRVARLVRRCRDLPGQTLFQYLGPDGEVAGTIGSDDVNAYLREIAGEGVSAKMFRTWGATVAASRALVDVGGSPRRPDLAAIREVAAELGNTPAVARKSYVHPAVIRAHEDGALAQVVGAARAEAVADAELLPEESATLEILRGEAVGESSVGRSRRARRAPGTGRSTGRGR